MAGHLHHHVPDFLVVENIVFVEIVFVEDLVEAVMDLLVLLGSIFEENSHLRPSSLFFPHIFFRIHAAHSFCSVTFTNIFIFDQLNNIDPTEDHF